MLDLETGLGFLTAIFSSYFHWQKKTQPIKIFFSYTYI